MGPEPEKNEVPESAPAVGLSVVHSFVSTPDFKAFADEIIETMWTGSMDSFDVEQIARKHNVIYPHNATEPCGENCNCNIFADEFPVKCWRKAY